MWYNLNVFTGVFYLSKGVLIYEKRVLGGYSRIGYNELLINESD